MANLELSFQRQAYGFVTGNFTSVLKGLIMTLSVNTQRGNIILSSEVLDNDLYVVNVDLQTTPLGSAFEQLESGGYIGVRVEGNNLTIEVFDKEGNMPHSIIMPLVLMV